jgi:thioredoxin-related protein
MVDSSPLMGLRTTLPRLAEEVLMKLLRTLLALAFWPALAHAAPAGEVGWLNWNQGVSEAALTGRPILVDVYTDWCGWCRRMDRDVYSRDDVREYLAGHFITVKLNAEALDEGRYQERNYTSRALAQQFRVSGYPTTVFLRPNGEHLVNVPGYVPANRFVLMLRYIGEDHIGRGVSWADFEKSATAARTRP